MDSHSSDRERLAELASTLGFDIDAETERAVLDAAASIDEEAGDLYGAAEPPTGSVGAPSDDEFGALLEVYDEPRTEATSGPLAGYTVAVKDVLAVEGLSLTCGSNGLSYVPSTDATVVRRLLEAGASVVGTANCDAFAFGPTGEFSERRTVVNPAAPDHIPGGSSSGSGAAVAAGLVDVALGTDSGGSVRIPAACCGVVGHKPTHGLVPRSGLVELSPSTDTIGPLAADVATVAETLAAVAGPDPRDPAATHPAPALDDLDEPGEELRIGVPSTFLDVADADVRTTIRAVLDALVDADADVAVDAVDLDLGALDRVYSLVIASEFAWLRRQSMVTRGQGTRHDAEWIDGPGDATLNRHVATRVLPAALVDAKTSGRSYAAGREQVLAFQSRVEDVFERVDLLLTPTLRTVPPELGRVSATEGMADIVGNTAPFSMSGNPAVSVPGGRVDGVPVGVQFVAPHYEDRRALAGARLVERVVGA